MDQQVDSGEVRAIVDKHNATCGGLIAILEEVQGTYGYLPEEALKIVASALDVALVDVYGVATFYKSFSLKPRGKHVICTCLGTACHVRGAGRVVESFENQLGIRAGETTQDNEFTLETVNCLGACALGPVTVIDGRYHSKVKTSGVKRLLAAARGEEPAGENNGHGSAVTVDAHCPCCNRSLMDSEVELDGRQAIRMSAGFDHTHGKLWFSSVYGSASFRIECAVPASTVMTMYCPHCHAELSGGSPCALCSAPVAALLILGGGALHICSRRGCPGRMLDIR